MKIILVFLASALSMAQAARLGLLRVDSYGPMNERSASAGFGYTRTLEKEDAFYAFRELMATSMSMSMSTSTSTSMDMSSPSGTSTVTPTSAPTVPTPEPTPTVTDSPVTAAPVDSVATSSSPTPAPQLASTGTAAPTHSVASAPSPTTAPTAVVGLGLPTPTGGVDQGLSSANQAENSGGTSGPDASQTILFIVVAFAAVAVGAALMARKFAASSGASSANGSVVSGPPHAPAADGRLVDEEL